MAYSRRRCLSLVHSATHSTLSNQRTTLLCRHSYNNYGGNAKIRFEGDNEEETNQKYPLLDLRSDTRATPNESMKRAMNTVMNTHMDDDVFGECKITQNLERNLADRLGFKDGLFVPSGTMGNLIACVVHCHMSGVMGNEMIVGDQSHIYYYEQGGVSQFGGITMRTLPNLSDGTMDLFELKKAIRPNHELDAHFPFTKLITLENTHNRCFGKVLPRDYIAKVRATIADDDNDEHDCCNHHGKLDDANRIRIHMDGARFFNAHAHWLLRGDESSDLLHSLTKGLDSMCICFSKGLGAPIGSVLLGNDMQFMKHSRRMRKALGGAMRNPAISAICGTVALEEFVTDDPLTNQLCKDARNAQRLAEGLTLAANDAGIPGFSAIETESNMVFLMMDEDEFPLSDEEFMQRCDEYRVMFMPVGKGRYRVVVYHQVGEEQVQQVIDRMRSMFQGM